MTMLLGLAVGTLARGEIGPDLAGPRDDSHCVRSVLNRIKVGEATESGCDELKRPQRLVFADGKVASDGLLLNYDFGRGSLPDTKGRIKDLSPSCINAVIRPTTAPLPAMPGCGLSSRVAATR